MKIVFTIIAIILSISACSDSVCNVDNFASSLKECKSFKCEKPALGLSYKVHPIENSMCEVIIGFHRTNQFMKCVAAIDDFSASYEVTSKWTNTKDSRSAKYEFPEHYVELFVNNESIGRPYEHLVSSGQCRYLEEL